MLNFFNSRGGGPGHGLTEFEGPDGDVPGEWPGLAAAGLKHDL